MFTAVLIAERVQYRIDWQQHTGVTVAIDRRRRSGLA
jgi:hypothetical protein